MKNIPIGIASSVSATNGFDLLDTIQFARQENFDYIQLYLNANTLQQKDTLQEVLNQQSQFTEIYYHAEGFLNNDFFESEYYKKMYSFLSNTISPNYIIHFDERMQPDQIEEIKEKIKNSFIKVYVENYFIENGKESSENNLKKYMDLFASSENIKEFLRPAIDIPRLFHKQTGFAPGESLILTYRLLNYFRELEIPLLLHMIDSTQSDMARHNFCPIGTGCMPYGYMLQFIANTQLTIESIILEFEDKVSPIESRDFIDIFFS